MAIARDLVVLDSRDQSQARCIVCGNDIAAGGGVTARYGGQMLRFKCPGCFSRFESDPELFLSGASGRCCGGVHNQSPPSEWTCE